MQREPIRTELVVLAGSLKKEGAPVFFRSLRHSNGQNQVLPVSSPVPTPPPAHTGAHKIAQAQHSPAPLSATPAQSAITKAPKKLRAAKAQPVKVQHKPLALRKKVQEKSKIKTAAPVPVAPQAQNLAVQKKIENPVAKQEVLKEALAPVITEVVPQKNPLHQESLHREPIEIPEEIRASRNVPAPLKEITTVALNLSNLSNLSMNEHIVAKDVPVPESSVEHITSIEREIRRNWRPPRGLSNTGTCVFKVRVRADGTVHAHDLKTEENSCVLSYYVSMREAILRSRFPQSCGKELILILG